METIVHNQTNLNFHDVERSAHYFFEEKFNKLSETHNCAVHVWIEPSSRSGEAIKCGVHLIRPNEKNLYVHKDGDSLSDAMKSSAKALFMSLDHANKTRH